MKKMLKLEMQRRRQGQEEKKQGWCVSEMSPGFGYQNNYHSLSLLCEVLTD